MNKMIVLLAVFFLSSTSVLAGNNILCNNKQTNGTDCLKTARKMYEDDVNNIVKLYIQMKQQRGEKAVNKKEAENVAKRQLPFETFLKDFNKCGENSKNYDEAMACLSYSNMLSRKK